MKLDKCKLYGKVFIYEDGKLVMEKENQILKAMVHFILYQLDSGFSDRGSIPQYIYMSQYNAPIQKHEPITYYNDMGVNYIAGANKVIIESEGVSKVRYTGVFSSADMNGKPMHSIGLTPHYTTGKILSRVLLPEPYIKSPSVNTTVDYEVGIIY